MDDWERGVRDARAVVESCPEGVRELLEQMAAEDTLYALGVESVIDEVYHSG